MAVACMISGKSYCISNQFKLIRNFLTCFGSAYRESKESAPEYTAPEYEEPGRECERVGRRVGRKLNMTTTASTTFEMSSEAFREMVPPSLPSDILKKVNEGLSMRVYPTEAIHVFR